MGFEKGITNNASSKASDQVKCIGVTNCLIFGNFTFDGCTWLKVSDINHIFLQIGKSKIFLRGNLMAELDAQRTGIYSAAAILIQKHFRARNDCKKYIAMRRACIRLQSYWRGDLPNK